MSERERPGLYIVFDGPPGPESGRFVEVETEAGRSVMAPGTAWREEPPYWTLGPFGTVPDGSSMSETKPLTAEELAEVRKRDEDVPWTAVLAPTVVADEYVWQALDDRHRLLATLDAERAAPAVDVERLVQAVGPFARMGGADGFMPAFHDLPDDIVVWGHEVGPVVTAGDVRSLIAAVHHVRAALAAQDPTPSWSQFAATHDEPDLPPIEHDDLPRHRGPA